uniref:DNA polymerase n=1 Tax=Mycena chlorophos TaxID=658473 RepID=A0ABQ0LE05_MYCCL|nr:DNA polymerase IV [Mycena chlorophos]
MRSWSCSEAVNKDDELQSPTKNSFKVRAFTQAINAIGQLDRPIRSADEVKGLKGVGAGIHRRIQVFFEETGHAPAVDEVAVQASKKARLARTELDEIPGIGAVKARALVDAGCTSIEQLQATPKFLEMLTKQQQIGVRYFRRLSRVSRVEAETVAQFVRDCVAPKYEIIIGGSYRRGYPDSSDIDLVVLHPTHVHVPFPDRRRGAPKRDAKTVLQSNMLPALTERGILAATLSSGNLKWQGIVRIPEMVPTGMDWAGERQRRITAIEALDGEFRRMDINLVAQKSRGAALLAFTGDTELNRELRARASKAGLHLNEFGLWRWNRAENESDNVEEGTGNGFWELVRSETEEEVLQELGMPYLDPTERNFATKLKRKP